MKILKILKFCILASLIISWLVTATEISGQTWSDEYTLGRGSAPRLALDPVNGDIHINYVSYSNSYTPAGMRYVHLNFSGNGFNLVENEAVPGGGSEKGYWYGGTTLAVDYNGRPHLIYRVHDPAQFGRFKMLYRKKEQTGWSSVVELKRNIYRAFSMDMVIDKSNRVHFCWTEKIDERKDGFYARIDATGLMNIIDKFNGSRWDNGVGIAADPTAGIQLVFGQPYSGNYPVSYYASSDSGETFQLIDRITAPKDQFIRAGHPDIAVDNNGTVHICYGSGKNEAANVNSKIQYVQYKNGVKTIHTTVAEGGGQFGDLDEASYRWFVSDIATGSNGKNIAIVYMTMDKAGKEWVFPETGVTRTIGGSLFVRMSNDYGNTWADAVRLTENCYLYDGRSQASVEAFGNSFFVLYEARDQVHIRSIYAEFDPLPVAVSSGPYNGYEGEELILNASASVDTGDNKGIVEYAWDLDDDGVFDRTSEDAIVAAVYPDNYSGKVVLKVMDRGGQFSYDTSIVHIENVIPKANAGGPYQGSLGQPVKFDGSRTSDPGSNENLIYQWDFTGDGKIDSTGIFPSWTFTTKGEFRILLQVSDKDGGIDTSQAMVSIRNVAPVWLQSLGNMSMNEDDTLSIDLSLLREKTADPDNSDNELEFSIQDNVFFHYQIDDILQTMKIFPNSNWNGMEAVVFTVKDPAMEAAFDTSYIRVLPQPDPPNDFSLLMPLDYNGSIWPDSLKFSWQEAVDPDSSNDVQYKWEISNVVTGPVADSTLVTTGLWFKNKHKLPTGEYTWRVEAFDSELHRVISLNTGQLKIGNISGLDEGVTLMSEKFALLQNFPNPFNPTTFISYALPRREEVSLIVYNHLGQKICVLESGLRRAGVHKVKFTATTAGGTMLPTGVYIYKLQAGKEVFIKKMLLIQ